MQYVEHVYVLNYSKYIFLDRVDGANTGWWLLSQRLNLRLQIPHSLNSWFAHFPSYLPSWDVPKIQFNQFFPPEMMYGYVISHCCVHFSSKREFIARISTYQWFYDPKSTIESRSHTDHARKCKRTRLVLLYRLFWLKLPHAVALKWEARARLSHP
jgi:hypothetical protein